jgi:dTDP-4-dehydrorhamnose 3,5-epimerase
MLPRSAQVFEGFRLGDIEDVVVRPFCKFVDERGWLAEVYRHDELEEEYHPAMCYVSSTEPNVTRGPHEHIDQADLFCFMGPSNFKLILWDNRITKASYRNKMTLIVGAENPSIVLVPKGVVHAYQNVGSVPGIVINCPNRLFKGERRGSKIDEVRHEDDPDTIFRMDD